MIALFYMHRGFFAQALEDNPIDPMASKYAESVLAAYRGACTFVGEIENVFNQHQALLERLWFLFTHVFSCAVSVFHSNFSGGLRCKNPRLFSVPLLQNHSYH